MRDGLGVRAERGGVEIAITGGLIVDPILGVRYASLGVTDGRIVSIGRAGNPDTMDGIDVVLDVGTAVLDATGMIVTPGGIDTHVHWLSPQVTDALLAGGDHDDGLAGLRADLEPRARTRRPGCRRRGPRWRTRRSTRGCSCAGRRRARSGSRTGCARAARR